MTRTFEPGSSDDPGVQAVAARALELVTDGARIGLGSGRASSLFIALLGAKVRDGLRVSGVPTSEAVAALARQWGIPLDDLEAGGELDVTIDGADEVTPALDLVKGWGGALVRERIVAAASARQIILVSENKLVRRLGERGRVPVEVIPLGAWFVARALEAQGMVVTRRMQEDGTAPYVTDNGNWILHCALREPLKDTAAARAVEQDMLAVPGVVDTGLFLGMAHQVLVGHTDGRVETLTRSGETR